MYIHKSSYICVYDYLINRTKQANNVHQQSSHVFWLSDTCGTVLISYAVTCSATTSDNTPLTLQQVLSGLTTDIPSEKLC